MRLQISLGLSNLSVPDLVEHGKYYATNILGNPTVFIGPQPTPVAVNTALTALELAYAASLNGGKKEKAVLDEKREIVIDLLTQLGHYVEYIAKGSVSVVYLAGMTVKGKGVRKPTIFRAKSIDVPFALMLQAPYVSRSAYVWQMIADTNLTGQVAPSDDDWKQIGISVKSSFLVTDLKVGVKYWFRYAIVDKDGQGAWSDPIGRMITG